MKYLIVLLSSVLFSISCNQNTKKDTATTAVPKEILQLNKKIEKAPADASLHFQRAYVYREIGEDSLAFLDLLATIKIDSTQAKYYSAIGDFLFDKKDISGSVKWFQKAISIDPNDEVSHLKMANLFLYSKKYPKAFAEINTVLKRNLYNAEAYFIKGMCYKDMGDMDKAISSFQTAVQTEPKYFDGFMQLGLLYSKQKNPLALQYFDNAIRLDSMNFESHYAKAMYYQSQGDYTNAKKVFKNAIRTDKTFAEAYYNIGFMLLQEDSTEKAKREFERVIAYDQDNAKAYYNRGLCNEILEKYQEAKDDYEQAIIFDPEFDLPTTALQRVKKKL